MKKTISITIGGQIFHIEEDGYDQLRRYLDSIQKYFASFPDSFEIVRDVESRIAELLQSRLQAGQHQAISLEDVQFVQSTMGTVEDFMAAEMEDDATSGSRAGNTSGQAAADPSGPSLSRRPLVKDRSDKIVDGVCAGIAGWLQIDPLWVRVLAVLLTFGAWIFPGTLLIPVAYVILAIVLPEGDVPATSKPKRHFFRDPDTKVLGGVAGGMANYFGMDLGLLRVLMVISVLFFGFGFWLYIVLWISTRYAMTTTEKMQMRGNPVTLSGIEQTLKENLNTFRSPSRPGEPSLLERILLLPFQLVATLFKGIGPLFRLIGIVVGIILLIASLSLLGVESVLGVSILSGTWDPITAETFHFDIDGYDFMQFVPIVPRYLGVLGLVLVTIPVLFMLFLAIALISNRWRVYRYASWALVGVWVLCLFAFLSIGLPFAQRFSQHERYTIRSTQPMPAGSLEINTREVSGDRFRGVKLRIKAGQSGDSLVLVQSIKGHGPTDEAAVRSAQSVRLGYALEHNTLRLDDHYTLDNPREFAAQEAELLILVPPGRPFLFTEEAERMLEEPRRLADGTYKWDARNHMVQFTEAGKLVCLNCPPRSEDGAETSSESNWDSEGDDVHVRVNVDGDDDSSGSVQMKISTSEDSAGIHVDVKDDQGGKTERVTIKAGENGVHVKTRKK